MTAAWMGTSGRTPADSADDVRALADAMAAGRVRGFAVTVLRGDGAVETMVGGYSQGWLHAVLDRVADTTQHDPRPASLANAPWATRGRDVPDL